jgi:hypothetical protein
MTLPQVRLQPWYPGQFGVAGSDIPRGLRWSPTAIVLYVDENHPGASATADGTDPENPLTSVQTAVNNLIAFATATSSNLYGSAIVIGAGATIAESVIVPPTAPRGVSIIGAGGSRHRPTWTAATAAGTALTIRQQEWTIEGITFEAGAEGTSVRLDEVPGSSYISYKTVISNCQFDGLWGGLYGIDLAGAPHRVTVENCEFLEWRSVAGEAFAVYISSTAHDRPLQHRYQNNLFYSNENHIGSASALASFNSSLFIGNVFEDNAYIATTIMLDLRGGTIRNIVVGNYFGGDYSNTGGYYASTAVTENWNGNFAEDMGEAEVGDNGLTIAPPAA